MEPQPYNDLMRHMAELYWQHLQVLAEQDPTLRRLQRVLEQDRAIMQMDTQALLGFITSLEAKYGVDHGRDA